MNEFVKSLIPGYLGFDMSRHYRLLREGNIYGSIGGAAAVEAMFSFVPVAFGIIAGSKYGCAAGVGTAAAMYILPRAAICLLNLPKKK